MSDGQVMDVVEGDFEMPVAAGNGMEKRREMRRAVDFRLGVILVGTQHMPELQVRAHDLSTRGIGYRSRRAFASGEVVVFRLPNVGGKERLVLGQVRHCRTSPEAVHVVGAEFVETVVGVSLQVPSRWMKLAKEGVGRNLLDRNSEGS